MTSTAYRWGLGAGLALLLLASIHPAAHGQSTPAAAAAIDFEAYTLGSPQAAGAKSVTMLSAPFAVRVPVGQVLALSASGAVARATVKDLTGATSTLSGPTDTEVRATLSTHGEGSTLSLAAVGLLPT